MNLELHRLTYTSKSTQGLLAMDGVSKFYTLEPPQGPELIPAGTYHVTKQWSERFQKLTPHLQDVPGHTYIEMHVGNDAADTEGCILVGDTTSPDWVGFSDVAFTALMRDTPAEFDLTIYDHALM